MPMEVIMPKVDMDMSSGRVSVWHAAAGDQIAKGDPLFDIETDKAAMEVESPGAGILRNPVAVGSEIPIGQPVAWLYAEGEDLADASTETASDAPESGQQHGAAAAALSPQSGPEPARSLADGSASPTEANSGSIRARATPLARVLARSAGMDIGSIKGTGPRGRVQAPDVRALLETPFHASEPILSLTPELDDLVATRSGTATGTPVVLIHGFASDTSSWALVESQIAHLPLIRIDLPGHGRSPKLQIRDFNHLAAIVRSAFDNLRLDEAHIIGHDLGGALALSLAHSRARSVASLTLLAPAGLGPEIYGEAIRGIARASRVESLEPWLKTFAAEERLFSKPYVKLVMASRKDERLRAAQLSMANVLFPDGVQSFDLRSQLARIRMPARILWGRMDRIIPWEHALCAPGHVAIHLLEETGHLPQIEAHEVVGHVISSQLNR